MAWSRGQIRRWIGGDLGELIEADSTETSSDPSQFASATDLPFPDGELIGREVWYTSSASPASAANKWTRRIITGSDEETASITVVPDWPALPQVGDHIELYNPRGYSVTIPEIHDKIGQLIADQSEEGQEIVASDPVTFVYNTPVVSYPSEWLWLHGVEYQRLGTTLWKMVPPSMWKVRTWDGNVEIHWRAGREMQNGLVRLLGSVEMTSPEDDDGIITVDSAWLVKQAVAELRLSTALRWGDAATALALRTSVLPEVEKMRPRAEGVFQGLGRRVRLKP